MNIVEKEYVDTTDIVFTLETSVERLLLSCRNKNMFKLLLNNVNVEVTSHKYIPTYYIYHDIDSESLLYDYVIEKANTSRSKDYISVYMLIEIKR